MGTGDNSGDLDRLEAKVEATRSELASIAGAVNGLTELVTDLVRRSSSDHQGERWQARWGSLETRLEMLETAIRSEVERMRATTGAVDALADDFRSTVGGTRTLVELAGNIGDQLGALQALERQVRGASQEIASVVEARLDQDASERWARDDALTEQLRSTVAERVDHIESLVEDRVRGAETALAGHVERSESNVATRVQQAESAIADQVDRVDTSV